MELSQSKADTTRRMVDSRAVSHDLPPFTQPHHGRRGTGRQSSRQVRRRLIITIQRLRHMAEERQKCCWAEIVRQRQLVRLGQYGRRGGSRTHKGTFDGDLLVGRQPARGCSHAPCLSLPPESETRRDAPPHALHVGSSYHNVCNL